MPATPLLGGLPRGAPVLGGESGFLVQRHLLEAGEETPPPPCPSEPGRPGDGPAPAASGNGRNPTMSVPTVHSAGIENSPFRKCCLLDLREGMAAQTENTE